VQYEEQVRRNIVLAHHFLQYLLDRPHALDDIPSGTHIILTDYEDSELCKANLALAEQRRREGVPVIVREAPMPAGR
jgi:Family of unknown function (DUF5647)